MNFDEAKYHGRHNMNSKHKFVLVTNDGNVHLSNDKLPIEGHLIKDNGDVVNTAPTKEPKKVKE